MRPRKDVLVIGDSDQMAAIRLNLKLGTRFRVWEVATTNEAKLALKKWPFYLVVAQSGMKGISAVVNGTVPLLLIDRHSDMAAILDRVIVLTTRKRGPRKQALAQAGQGEREPAGALGTSLER